MTSPVALIISCLCIPPKHSLKILQKSKRFPRTCIRKRECLFLNTVYNMLSATAIVISEQISDCLLDGLIDRLID